MNLGNFLIPGIIGLIVTYGVIKKVEVYNCFVEGAKDGLKICLRIFPYLLAMILAVSVLREAKILDFITQISNPLLKYVGIPGEILPLLLIKPLSGSGALGVFTDVLTTYGPDSFVGRVASTIMGSTETIFYTVTIYFGAVGVKKIRHTLWAAILADLTAAIMAVITVKLFFY
ncbi:Spore maturation protein B [bioreactor metagenome]|uniref:Spore maturation protein B n=1 Tax=bioreactor metagenome TaxID=1076179 RepID=A0A645CZ32_9ZZZZ|nr:nucleoside recognition domain-containing protein [Clostridium sp. HMP27]KGK90637.1 spore maturation protein [Clostridium sp. HMP27]